MLDPVTGCNLRCAVCSKHKRTLGSKKKKKNRSFLEMFVEELISRTGQNNGQVFDKVKIACSYKEKTPKLVV